MYICFRTHQLDCYAPWRVGVSSTHTSWISILFMLRHTFHNPHIYNQLLWQTLQLLVLLFPTIDSNFDTLFGYGIDIKYFLICWLTERWYIITKKIERISTIELKKRIRDIAYMKYRQDNRTVQTYIYMVFLI